MKEKLVMFILSAVLLSGCSSVSGNMTEDQKTLEADTFPESAGDSSEIENSIISPELQQIPDFAGDLDFTYIYDTDAESDLEMYSNVVYIKEGFYRLEAKQDIQNMFFGFQLFFYDAQTEEKVLVCSKSNCTHEGTDCDAFFDGMEYGNGILYYQDALYQVKTDEDYLKLEKISKDGSVREDACTLLRQVVETTTEEDGTQSSRYYFPEVQIHRGYVYFANVSAECDGDCLYRMPLEGDAEPELLFKLSGVNSNIYSIKPYGKYIVFQMENSDESGKTYTGSIYAYDTVDSTVSRMKENALLDFCISDNFLYYFQMDGTLWRLNLGTGEEILYHESERQKENDCIRVFPYQDCIIYQIQGWETRSYTQYVLDKGGEEVEVLREKQENEILHPYTF